MALEFFCSYTRSNNDAYLQRFIEDLCDRVREKRGLPKEARPGFFDQQDIERGAAWDPTIVAALRVARIFVALASPGYFNSEYCAKEFAIFASRAPGTFATGALPPVIKPVVWIPIATENMPMPFGALQFTTGDPQSIVNVKGLKYVVRQRPKYAAEYEDFVESLADDIVAATPHVLPPLATVPRLDQVAPAWTVPAPGTIASAPGIVSSSPTRVRFVYVAAHPQLLPQGRDPQPYQQVGASDWKPFWPDSRRIHQVLQHVVSSDELAFSSEELPFSPNLMNDVRQAWAQRDVVVIVVDPWSVYWDAQQPTVGYHNWLVQLDQTNAVHWCVLIPWNEQDQLMNHPQARVAIEQTIATTFYYKGGHAPGYVKNALYYRDGIRSFDELKGSVIEVLTRLKEEIKRVAEISRPIPDGPSKAVVTGVGTTGAPSQP
jgi:FxsC-like protein